MTPSHAPCPNCREALEERDERIVQLEALAFAKELQPPASWRLTRDQAVMMRLLATRALVTPDAIMLALGSVRPAYEIGSNALDVMVSKMRAKLRPFNIAISTHWGAGWSIEEPIRSRVKAVMSGDTAADRRDIGVIRALVDAHPHGITATLVAAALPSHEAVALALRTLAERGEIQRTRLGPCFGYVYRPAPEKRGAA